ARHRGRLRIGGADCEAAVCSASSRVGRGVQNAVRNGAARSAVAAVAFTNRSAAGAHAPPRKLPSSWPLTAASPPGLPVRGRPARYAAARTPEAPSMNSAETRPTAAEETTNDTMTSMGTDDAL